MALPIRLHYTKPEMLRSQVDALEEPVDGWVVDITNPPEKIVEYILGLLEREKKERFFCRRFPFPLHHDQPHWLDIVGSHEP